MYNESVEERKCFQVWLHNGFTDFTPIPVSCQAQNLAAVYCAFSTSEMGLENPLSDIKGIEDKGFTSMFYSHSCPMGWYRVEDNCVSIMKRENLSTSFVEICAQNGSHLAYNVFQNVSLTNIADSTTVYTTPQNSSLNKLWTSFLQKQTKPDPEQEQTQVILIKINDSVLNQAASFIYVHCYRGSAEITFYHHVWSFLALPLIKSVYPKDPRKGRFALCEKPVLNDPVSSNCSDYYFTCADGTCIHDSFRCDGINHCKYGEDEARCSHICSSPNINCITDCHIENFCTCALGYFQCLSGGCVPLQKICDVTVHCGDASDEPVTCTYIEAQEMEVESRKLPANQHINKLINQITDSRHKCFKPDSVTPLSLVDYKIFRNKTIYNVTFHSVTGMYGMCLDWTHMIKSSAQYKFPLHLLCIYGHEWDQFCSNGFHLLNCEHMFCSGHFKCVSSYCVSFEQVCNGKCECSNCEDEAFCTKLLCPGLLLLERLGSKLYCSAESLKHKTTLNKRQVISNMDTNVADDYAVYIHVQGKTSSNYATDFPELVIYCTIREVNLFFTDIMAMLSRMVSLKVVDISSNDLIYLPPLLFQSNFQLILLNVSHNSITVLPGGLLCPLEHVLYIFLDHNEISVIQQDLFQTNSKLKFLSLHSNKLHPVLTNIIAPQALQLSLKYLSSDIPRLCCVFYEPRNCSPPLPFFMSCSNMITSQVQVVSAWIIGITTTSLNLICVVSLSFVLFIKIKLSSAKGSVTFLSLNLSVSEMIMSVCLLSYPCYNVYYDGIFGAVADQWRHSWRCFALESLFFTSSQVFLATSVVMSLHFAIVIPSIVPQNTDSKQLIWIIIGIWISIISITLALMSSQISITSYPMNYFCLPFITSTPSSPAVQGIYISLIITDCILVATSISCYVFLFIYIRKQINKKSLKAVQKRAEALQKFAARMALVILSTTLTWLPILLLQLIILIGTLVQQHIVLWILLSCLPVNLIIDPILVIINTATAKQ